MILNLYLKCNVNLLKDGDNKKITLKIKKMNFRTFVFLIYFYYNTRANILNH